MLGTTMCMLALGLTVHGAALQECDPAWSEPTKSLYDQKDYYQTQEDDDKTNSDTLRLVHVVFRHGDRTPDAIGMYPKDPHINDTWYPEGLGALTMLGKTQEYNIGRKLRRTYNRFLGSIYTPDVMDAWSTDYNRTKMSLELVLAGLWPPAPSQTWNMLLPWQPVPYNYVEMARDKLLQFSLKFCPIYYAEFIKVSQQAEFDGWMKQNADLINYINENSGLQLKTLLDIFTLYFGLYAEEKTGRALPEWTKKIFPEFLEHGAILCYELQTYNDVLKRSSGGRLVKKIIDDARDKINGTLQPKNRKLFLYSGHEYNIVYLQAALNVYKPHVPPYASYVVVELHKIKDVYGIKVLYQDYKKDSPELLTIPGCESFCPLDKFEELTENIVPTDSTC